MGPYLARGVSIYTHARASLAVGNKFIDETVSLDLTNSEDSAMNKDRIKGSAEQAKGSVKEAAGKVLGDKKLRIEGTTEKAAGKLRNAAGGLKDAVRGK
jgi:uncharacterized protein YjbJ (UPF0337 family)